MATPDDFAFADAHGGSGGGAPNARAPPPPPPQQQRRRQIAIPSLEDVRAAEAREPQEDIHDPRAMMRAHRAEQQRQQQAQEQQQAQPQPQQQAQTPVWPPPLLPHAPGPPRMQGVLPAASVPRFGVDAPAAAAAAGSYAPPPQPVSGNPQNAIVVARRQQGNPVLRHLRHVRWRWAAAPDGSTGSSNSNSGSGAPDFVLGDSTAALFLSLRFHLLNPAYIGGRLRALQQRPGGGGGGGSGGQAAQNASSPYRLVVLLLLVDAEDPARPLAELSQLCLRAEASLVCATSEAEAARYLEAFQAFERKATGGGGGGGGTGGAAAGGGTGGISSTLGAGLRPPPEPDYLGRVSSVLSAVRGVNRADALRLAEAFGSVAGMLRASGGEMAAVRGVGPTKVRRLHEAFAQPFRRTLVVRAGQQQQQNGAAATRADEQAGDDGAAAASPPPSSARQQQPRSSPPPPLTQPRLEMPIATEEEEEGDDDEENDRLLQLADELGI